MSEHHFSDDEHRAFVRAKLDSIDKNLTWIVKASIGLIIGIGISIFIEIGIGALRGLFH